MIIRIILITLIIVMIIWFMRSRTTNRIKAMKKVTVTLLAFFAITVVLFPGITNDAAHYIGVGRGADLLLYLLTMAFIAYVLNQYIHSKNEEQRFNELARKIAIIEAQSRHRNK